MVQLKIKTLILDKMNIENANKLAGLKPESIWNYFEAVCQIPRPSKKEEKIIGFLIEFAQNHNLNYKKDLAGNILISKPGSKGFEERRTVVLQSHLDMVCEKNNETIHNFEIDPIKAYIDGDWVTADGTTLGADCGIGIAAQLAILSDEELSHGPIECLFTVDEETGLTGAKAIEPGFFTGKALVNLDSEDDGELFIGCAGGIDTVATIHYQTITPPSGLFAIRISIGGLQGGHSGDDINKNRGNAIKILNRFLWQTMQHHEIYISDYQGGNLRNAIAREASAVILIPSPLKEQITVEFNLFRSLIESEIILNEPAMALCLESFEMPSLVIDRVSQVNLVNAIYASPHGVLAMSSRMPGMVETSSNLAAIKIKPGNLFEITTSQRSDIGSSLIDASSMVSSVFQLINADVVHSEGYPGWAPNPNSELLQLTKSSYIKLFNNEPIVLFLEKFPDLDMISFGPTMRGVHSPDERINIHTVDKFWQLLTHLLANY
jgi:dipeptidase D